jgi:hypothetical protein
MARGPIRPLKRVKAQCSEPASDLGLYVGADDGNRTRTVSLGICTVRPRTPSDQRRNRSASDRETPLITGVNGTLMARPADGGDLLLLPNRVSGSGGSGR